MSITTPGLKLAGELRRAAAALDQAVLHTLEKVGQSIAEGDPPQSAGQPNFNIRIARRFRVAFLERARRLQEAAHDARDVADQLEGFDSFLGDAGIIRGAGSSETTPSTA